MDIGFLYHKRNLKIIESSILFSVLFFLLIMLMTWFNRRPISEGLCLFAFQVCAVFLPGVAFTLWVKGGRHSFVELLAYGYTFGYCLNIIVYYMFVPFGIKEMVLPFYCVLTVISIVLIYIKRAILEEMENSGEDCFFCWGWILFIFFLQMVLFNTNNLPPSIVGNTVYSSDLMYWLGDAIELSREYPPILFRDIEITKYYYHFFSSMQLAVVHLITQIPFTVLGFSYSYIQPTLLLVFASYLLFRKSLRCDWGTVHLLTLLFLFSTGYEKGFGINYVSHMYCASFGFDISLSMAVITLALFMETMRKGNVEVRTYICMVLTFAVCMGSKGAIGAILLLHIGVIYAFCFFKDRQWKRILWQGMVLLLVFGVLYLFVIGGSNSTSSTLSLESGANLTSTLQGTALRDYYEFFLIRKIPQVFAFFLSMLILLLGSNYGLFGLMLVLLILKRGINRYDIASIGACLVGAGLTLAIKHPSWSQQYFTMATFPSALVFCGLAVNEYKVKLKDKGKYITLTQKYAIVMLAILNSVNFCTVPYFLNNFNAAKEYLTQGTLQPADWYDPNFVTVDEAEAYDWIRTNTEEESILACNLILGENKLRLYVPGVFSERYIWMSDEDLIGRAVNNDAEAIERMKQNNIDYLIVLSRISMADLGLKDSMELVYFNGDVEIYTLN